MTQNEARMMILSDVVTHDTIKGLVERIFAINMYDDMMNESHKGYNRQPIVLIVNSPGGSVYDGFALIAAIEMSATRVVTICLGSAMSMGLAIFEAGHHRVIHELSCLMYHEVSTKLQGSLTQIKLTASELERLQMQYDMYIMSKSDVTEKRLTEVKHAKEEWVIDANDALKLGLADMLIKIGEPLRWAGGEDEGEEDDNE